MRSASAIVLLVLGAQVQGEELLTNEAHIVNRLLARMLEVLSFNHVVLNDVTLAKPESLSVSPIMSMQPAPIVASRQRPLWSPFKPSRPLVRPPRAAATDTQGTKLTAWARLAEIELNGVEVKSFGNGLRGVAASSAIQPKTVVINAPESTILDVVNNKNSKSPFPDFVPQSLWDISLWDERLAYKLLYEVKIRGAQSDKYGWIGTLPKSFSTPLHWTADSIHQAQYRGLEDKVKEQKQLWERLYKQWQESGASQAAMAKYEDFEWAMECVNSRTFSGPFEGSSNKDRQRLLIFTGGLAALWPLAGLGSWQDSLFVAVTVGLGILFRDVIFSQTSELKRYVMCPVLDMFNHRSTSTAEPAFNYFTGKVELLTGPDETYSRGDQVYITYGKQGNDRLLQFYGFVEADNIHDSYDFCESFLQVYNRLRGLLKDKVGDLPQEPSTAQRWVQLANLLKDRGSVEFVVGNVEENAKEGDESADKMPVKLKAIETSRFFRGTGWDELTMRCMRALCASSTEWKNLCSADGQLNNLEVLGTPLSAETERRGTEALKALAKCELDSLPTTLEDDLQAKAAESNGAIAKGDTKESSEANMVVDPSGSFREANFAALAFRIEKKKLLQLASRWENRGNLRVQDPSAR
eukprot:gnl/MRDRNA2_/MRDRNA2_62363_c0_seq1.p1 gnl/MRDRNA2_/MRDRNA2_62363_c0~~gnl/MRDRNA2_/MRDRNA2_62363_c0_seq1.p1  ORF type:complete len:637 (+),score=120.78 gnl/MRDRNA2_/MRDRNA2_62363_c0_seq1:134-2044(+)